jgi:hypothetical protein
MSETRGRLRRSLFRTGYVALIVPPNTDMKTPYTLGNMGRHHKGSFVLTFCFTLAELRKTDAQRSGTTNDKRTLYIVKDARRPYEKRLNRKPRYDRP